MYEPKIISDVGAKMWRIKDVLMQQQQVKALRSASSLGPLPFLPFSSFFMPRPSLSRIFAILSLTAPRKRMPYYAVAIGHKPGIYETWKECQKQTIGFAGTRYKKFATEAEAKQFVEENASHCPVVDRRKAVKEEETPEQTTSRTDLQNGRLSPTLLEMKASMKRLQKELSILRNRFDDYVEARGGINSNANHHHHHPLPSSSAAQKRKHNDDNDNDESEAGAGDDRTEGPPRSKKLNVDARNYDCLDFSVDSDGYVIVYTDGACWMNGRHGAKAGIGVFFGAGHPLNASEPVKGRATNNNAEIQAATLALELSQAAGFTKAAVHSDSQFMINCASKWMKNWKKNGWVKRDKEPVKNKEELILLDEAMEGMAVKWVHVKGHAGHEGNEEADKLAKAGGKRYIDEENN